MHVECIYDAEGIDNVIIYIKATYPSMDKGIICNSIEHILKVLSFWCPKMHHLLYAI